MHLVDDYVALKALARRPQPEWADDPPLVPWVYHVRLLRALLDKKRTGQLSQSAYDGALDDALNPSPQVLVPLTTVPDSAEVVQLMEQHAIPMAAASLLQHAIHHDATAHFHPLNYTPKVREAIQKRGVTTVVHDPSDWPVEHRADR